jgi:hypothetical protein
MNEETLSSKTHLINKRTIRAVAIAVIVVTLQHALPSPKAEANIVTDIGVAVTSNYLWDVGKNICGAKCGAAATAATVLIYNYGPVVATKTVEYTKPGLVEMFTNWGSTFFRP